MRRTSTDRAYLEDGTVIIDADGIEVELPPNNHTHHRLDNAHGVLTLDASGGVQHHAGGTRRWWVDETGTVRAGTIPTARVSGLTAALYDSGLRSLTALFGLTSGAAYLHVKNGWVWLLFNNAVLAGTGVVTLTSTGLASVAVQAPVASAEGEVRNSATAPRRVDANRNGQVRIIGVTEGDVLNGSLTWPMTRPAPNTWPGAATT